MSALIHPSAIVAPSAQIGMNAEIGPFCIIGPHVKIGAGTILKSHVVIDGHTTIGENCRIFPFASLGSPPQDLKYAGEPSTLTVGDNNTIREYATMNTGTKDGGMATIVGSNGLFMVSSHVAHDCRVGNNVILANCAAVAGHVQVGDHAILGGLSAVHQFVRIGAHAIIGGMSAVENDVIPYGRVKGDRAHLAGLNLIGLERRGFGKENIRLMQRAFNQMFGEEGTLEDRLESVARDFANDDTIMEILSFAREKTKFPLCQPPRR
jgi:UDP-N-acetylglucosamine acyltransferase